MLFLKSAVTLLAVFEEEMLRQWEEQRLKDALRVVDACPDGIETIAMINGARAWIAAITLRYHLSIKLPVADIVLRRMTQCHAFVCDAETIRENRSRGRMMSTTTTTSKSKTKTKTRNDDGEGESEHGYGYEYEYEIEYARYTEDDGRLIADNLEAQLASAQHVPVHYCS
jgi:hypothetical protein